MAEINYSNFTLGIEEEYMVIDPNSRELKSHEQRIVTEGQKMIKDKVKAEMHQAVVEVGTDICRDVQEARKDISTLRKTISQIATDIGLRLSHLFVAGSKTSLLVRTKDGPKNVKYGSLEPATVVAPPMT